MGIKRYKSISIAGVALLLLPIILLVSEDHSATSTDTMATILPFAQDTRSIISILFDNYTNSRHSPITVRHPTYGHLSRVPAEVWSTMMTEMIQEIKEEYKKYRESTNNRYKRYSKGYTTLWPNDPHAWHGCSKEQISSLSSSLSFISQQFPSGAPSTQHLSCYRTVSMTTIPASAGAAQVVIRHGSCIEHCTSLNKEYYHGSNNNNNNNNNKPAFPCAAVAYQRGRCYLLGPDAFNNTGMGTVPFALSMDGSRVDIPAFMWDYVTNSTSTNTSVRCEGTHPHRFPLRRLSRHYPHGGTRSQPAHVLFSMITASRYIRSRMLPSLGTYLYPYPVLLFLNDLGEERNNIVTALLRPLTHPTDPSGFGVDVPTSSQSSSSDGVSDVGATAPVMGARRLVFLEEPDTENERGTGAAWKNFPMLRHLYDNIQAANTQPEVPSLYHARWFIFIDDDTFFIPYNLELMLASFYLHEAYQKSLLSIGWKHGFGRFLEDKFIHGGSGIMLPSYTASTMGNPSRLKICLEKNCTNRPFGDVRMGCCYPLLGIELVSTAAFLDPPVCAFTPTYRSHTTTTPFPYSFHRENNLELHAISQHAATSGNNENNKCPQFISWEPYRFRYEVRGKTC